MASSLAHSTTERETTETRLLTDLGLAGAEWRCLAGGANSRVLLVTPSGDKPLVAKQFHPQRLAQRDYLGAEYSGLSFLWQHGLRRTPRPLALHRELGCLTMTFLAGQSLNPSEIGTVDVSQAAGFMVRLAELSRLPEADGLPNASDACFSLDELLGNLEARLAGLDNQPRTGPEYDALREFSNEKLHPTLDRLGSWAREGLARVGWGRDVVLEPEARILSPSDFGFHNALRDQDGQLSFLDFEHFGWDDPAKMVSDFALHPAMGLSADLATLFAKALLSELPRSRDLAERVRYLGPLYALKWCLILLNEFLPRELARRRFAAATGSVREVEIRWRQLDKARTMCDRAQALVRQPILGREVA